MMGYFGGTFTHVGEGKGRQIVWYCVHYNVKWILNGYNKSWRTDFKKSRPLLSLVPIWGHVWSFACDVRLDWYFSRRATLLEDETMDIDIEGQGDQRYAVYVTGARSCT